MGLKLKPIDFDLMNLALQRCAIRSLSTSTSPDQSSCHYNKRTCGRLRYIAAGGCRREIRKCFLVIRADGENIAAVAGVEITGQIDEVGNSDLPVVIQIPFLPCA